MRSQVRAVWPLLRTLAFPVQRIAAAHRHEQLAAGACSARSRSTSWPTRRPDAPGRSSPDPRRARRRTGTRPRRPRSSQAASAAADRRAGPSRPRRPRSARFRSSARLAPRSPMPLIESRSNCSSVLGDVQPSLTRADHVLLRHAHVVEEGLAERRGAADQQDRLGRDARASSCRSAGSVMPSCFLARRSRCAPGRRSSRPCRRTTSRSSGR